MKHSAIAGISACNLANSLYGRQARRQVYDVTPRGHTRITVDLLTGQRVHIEPLDPEGDPDGFLPNCMMIMEAENVG